MVECAAMILKCTEDLPVAFSSCMASGPEKQLRVRHRIDTSITLKRYIFHERPIYCDASSGEGRFGPL